MSAFVDVTAEDDANRFLSATFGLRGRVGIVTGQSSGLGLAISHALAEAGATVFGLNRTVRSEADRDGVTQLAVDVTDETAIAESIRTVGERHGLDFLINNAGVTHKAPATEISMQQWRQVQQTNVDAAFRAATAAFDYLSRSVHVGRVVTIASMAAHLGFTDVVPYCASKAAVTGLTRGLAVEWAPHNVLVNTISPGWFPSRLNQKVLENDPERARQILSRIALGRYGDPADVASAAVFLVGDGARYVTGQDLAVDGGALALGF
ncbi:SDR family NAD(P)-dependent oxidoreductase [Pseudactinotalea terrae]|uniref:SDR family NAD(P)-dependent oxidoreductase n=1 Tax=Pseudactinotalea terrae TaxID=1743262 RepID=UPI0012E2D8A1|nr:SDR family oxidoreductase [Pseudactinotalea terrae]